MGSIIPGSLKILFAMMTCTDEVPLDLATLSRHPAGPGLRRAATGLGVKPPHVHPFDSGQTSNHYATPNDGTEHIVAGAWSGRVLRGRRRQSVGV